MAKRLANIERRKCVACGACTKVCPRSAIKVWKGCYAVVDGDACVGCGKCGKICPAGVIEIRERVGNEKALV